MRRHLPLLGIPPDATVSSLLSSFGNSLAERVPLAPASVGLADTSTGLVAAEFAVELAVAFSSLGDRVAIVLLGFEGAPVLPHVLATRLAGLTVPLVSQAIDERAPLLPSALASATDALQLWVGLPAATVFAPRLAVLLGADRPLTGWPSPLRAHRASFQLELSQPRPGLAWTLASALHDHGFLLRR